MSNKKNKISLMSMLLSLVLLFISFSSPSLVMASGEGVFIGGGFEQFELPEPKFFVPSFFDIGDAIERSGAVDRSISQISSWLFQVKSPEERAIEEHEKEIQEAKKVREELSSKREEHSLSSDTKAKSESFGGHTNKFLLKKPKNKQSIQVLPGGARQLGKGKEGENKGASEEDKAGKNKENDQKPQAEDSGSGSSSVIGYVKQFGSSIFGYMVTKLFATDLPMVAPVLNEEGCFSDDSDGIDNQEPEVLAMPADDQDSENNIMLVKRDEKNIDVVILRPEIDLPAGKGDGLIVCDTFESSDMPKDDQDSEEGTMKKSAEPWVQGCEDDSQPWFFSAEQYPDSRDEDIVCNESSLDMLNIDGDQEEIAYINEMLNKFLNGQGFDSCLLYDYERSAVIRSVLECGVKSESEIDFHKHLMEALSGPITEYVLDLKIDKAHKRYKRRSTKDVVLIKKPEMLKRSLLIGRMVELYNENAEFPLSFYAALELAEKRFLKLLEKPAEDATCEDIERLRGFLIKRVYLRLAEMKSSVCKCLYMPGAFSSVLKEKAFLLYFHELMRGSSEFDAEYIKDFLKKRYLEIYIESRIADENIKTVSEDDEDFIGSIAECWRIFKDEGHADEFFDFIGKVFGEDFKSSVEAKMNENESSSDESDSD